MMFIKPLLECVGTLCTMGAYYTNQLNFSYDFPLKVGYKCVHYNRIFTVVMHSPLSTTLFLYFQIKWNTMSKRLYTISNHILSQHLTWTKLHYVLPLDTGWYTMSNDRASMSEWLNWTKGNLGFKLVMWQHHVCVLVCFHDASYTCSLKCLIQFCASIHELSWVSTQ